MYFNSQFPNCMTDLQAVVDAADWSKAKGTEEIEAQLNRRLAEGLRHATWRLAGELYHFLEERGCYHAGNRGHYSDSLAWEDRDDLSGKLRGARDPDAERAGDLLTYRITPALALEDMRSRGIPSARPRSKHISTPNGTRARRSGRCFTS